MQWVLYHASIAWSAVSPLTLQYFPWVRTSGRGSSVPILLQKSLMVLPNNDSVLVI
jgi:hypothetical protein